MIIDSEDPREKITLQDLIELAKEKYYVNKSKRHPKAFLKAKSIICGLAIQNQWLSPKEIANSIERNKNNPNLVHQLVVGKELKSQVRYYLNELIDIEIVEKKEKYYRLVYKVIPSWPEKDISFYLKSDKPDLSVILPLLEIIRGSCDQLIDYFQGE